MAMQAQFMNMSMDVNTAFGTAKGKVYGNLIQQSTLNAYKLYAIAIIILIPFVFILRKFEGQKSKAN